jgi:outer membrane cobalamin receptor
LKDDLYNKPEMTYKILLKGKSLVTPCFLLMLFALLPSRSIAQSDTLQLPEYFQMTMESLLEKQDEPSLKEIVSIATQVNTPLRESPGIVTVITREDIQSSGARDLVDLLWMVPGLDFGMDVQNIIGLGVRGNWAFEGKVLVTVDGQMMNETSYGTYGFAHRMLLDNIERIEIIRGPGSAIYGGTAGLAVINIITRKGKDLQGFVGSSEIAFTNGRSRYNNLLTIGDVLQSGLMFNVAAGMSEANMSNWIDSLPNKTLINYQDSSAVISYFLASSFQYKQLQMQYRYEDYKVDIIKIGGKTHFGGQYVNLQYAIPINSRLNIVPQLSGARQIPWNLLNVPDNPYDRINWRFTGKVQSAYEPNPNFTLVSGIEAFYDFSKIAVAYSESVFTNGKSRVGFSNLALFNQGILKTSLANFTAGVRMDNHRAFGIAFSPRLGITKEFKSWHIKLLYNSAYKAPTLANLNANPELQPERIRVAELEAGYQINKAISIKGNIFDTELRNTIVYEAIDDIIDHYRNGGHSGSRGGEISLQAKDKQGTVSANYSFYWTSHQVVEEFRVPVDAHVNLGFPAHKVTLQGSYIVNPHISFHSSMLLLGKKYAFIPDSQGESELKLFSPVVLANLNVKFSNFLYKGLHLTAGLYNLFNSNYSYVQPYVGEDRRVPSQSRELAVKLLFTSHK